MSGRTYSLMRCDLKAPAKVNVRLHVQGRVSTQGASHAVGVQNDGYHLLSMINLKVGLCDTLALELSESVGDAPSVEVVVRGPTSGGINPLENSVVRAAQEFMQVFRAPAQIKITLTKYIPHGAGLGGGSSDAAAVLRGLYSMRGDTSSDSATDFARLMECALRVGADVPFFLQSHASAWVGGIGQEIRSLPLPALKGRELWLVLLPCACPTPEVYQRFRELCPDLPQQVTQEEEFRALAKLAQEITSVNDLFLRLARNDLEQASVAIAPLVGEVLGLLRSTAWHTALTGSGSCVVVYPQPNQLSMLPQLQQRLCTIDRGIQLIPTPIW